MANIVHHGYGPGGEGRIGLRLSLAGEAARLEVSDRAPAFDPLVSEGPSERSAHGGGGLGLHLVRQLFDKVEYTRENGENRLVLERRRQRPGP